MLRNQRPERHMMELHDTHDSGAEEWFCPTCGRRFLMQWPPNFKRIILEPGDEGAIHTGGKGGVHTSIDGIGDGNGHESDGLDPWPSWLPPMDAAPEQAEEPGLSPELMEALEELDFSPLDIDDQQE